jgi:cobalt-precorrin-5B (C1)-methyltransferase
VGSLRWGLSTGTCAAAAAKAAALRLCHDVSPPFVDVPLPDGARVTLAVCASERSSPEVAVASVRKDAGDDPDVTHGALVRVALSATAGGAMVFEAGDGVGVVTRPGLAVAPGEAAINPVPRQMIADAIAEVTARAFRVRVCIPGGKRLAARTFNPRLGIEGGLSILGTTGRVRPFSQEAQIKAMCCAMDVAAAAGHRALVLVPGNLGRRAAETLLRVTPVQIAEVGNAWGALVDHATTQPFTHLLALGHPGKLAKLVNGHWDTHSSRSASAVPLVSDMARQGCSLQATATATATTVEAVLQGLPLPERQRLGEALSRRIRHALAQRTGPRLDIAVALCDLSGTLVANAGDLAPWT